jgi:hypothetical protein
MDICKSKQCNSTVLRALKVFVSSGSQRADVSFKNGKMPAFTDILSQVQFGAVILNAKWVHSMCLP